MGEYSWRWDLDEVVKIYAIVLALCRYFQDVLQSPLLSTDDNEIQLNQDGSWSTHVEKNGVCGVVESPQKPTEQKVEVISVDLDSTIEMPSSVQNNMLKMCLRSTNGPGTNGSSSAEASNGSGGGGGEPSNETVDLTLSDSDDDVPQRNRKRPGPLTSKK